MICVGNDIMLNIEGKVNKDIINYFNYIIGFIHTFYFDRFKSVC